jgi:uncharacterized protein YndB with AHSA1/START domain
LCNGAYTETFNVRRVLANVNYVQLLGCGFQVDVQSLGCTLTVNGRTAMDDRIEQTIDIHAPLDRVWELVSEPGWWVPSAVVAPVSHRPGHQVVRESEKWGRFPVEVVRVEPRTYAAFRWASQSPGAELTPVNTTLVEFRVEPAGDTVRVTVTESGFAALDVPEADRERAHKDNTGGWELELNSLRERAESSS